MTLFSFESLSDPKLRERAEALWIKIAEMDDYDITINAIFHELRAVRDEARNETYQLRRLVEEIERKGSL